MNQKLSREEQAYIEVGHTKVTPCLARVIVCTFIIVIFSVPLLEMRMAPFVAGDSTARWMAMAGNIPSVDEIREYENQVDNHSVIRQRLYPLLQPLLSRLGLGNEQVYLGSEDWLYYAPNVDHLTGKGFLEPSELLRRSQLGSEWQQEPQPDPVKAIVDFADQLQQRNIQLIVMPIPSKASIYPEFLSDRFEKLEHPLQNSSYSSFIQQLNTHNVKIFDPSIQFLEAKKRGTQVFLKTDTHWTPDTVELTAVALSNIITEFGVIGPKSDCIKPEIKQSTIENIGDIIHLLHIGENNLERTEAVQINELTSAPIDKERAPVLLLGDSFSNIYSLEQMEWGNNAGLAERLSSTLGVGVNKIAVNGDGAFRSRQQLVQQLQQGNDILAHTKVVIFEFAMRELSEGNWKLFSLEKGKPRHEQRLTNPLRVEGTVADLSQLPQPGTVPYRDAITAMHLVDVSADVASFASEEMIIFHWGMRNNRLTAVNKYQVGDRVQLEILPWSQVLEEFGSFRRIELEQEKFFRLATYWDVNSGNRESLEGSEINLVKASKPHKSSVSDTKSTNTKRNNYRLEGDLSNDELLTDLQAIVSNLEQKQQNVLIGRENWLFLTEEIRYLSVGRFWGDATTSQVGRKDGASQVDPLRAIVDLNRQLQQSNIELLLVPVPAKAALYPEMLSSPGSPSNNLMIDEYLHMFIDELGKNGVNVLHLTPAFYQLKQRGIAPYLKQDSHWTPAAMELAAQLIANWIEENAKSIIRQPSGQALYNIRGSEFSVRGDLLLLLQNTIPEDVFPTQTINVNQVINSETNRPFVTSRDSPVLLMGDSHTLVFHSGGDMFSSAGGLPDHLAKELGFSVDLIGIKGSGITQTRLSLMRRRDNLAGKKLVIWCFSARAFTESSGGWPLIPVVR